LSNPPSSDRNLDGLAILLILENQIKNTTNLREYGYFVTNETHRLLFYDTAFLWKRSDVFDIQLLAQSEILEIDPLSPLCQSVQNIIKSILKIDNVEKIQALNFAKDKQNPDEWEKPIPNPLMQENSITNWPQYLRPYVLWCPFVDNYNKITGGLILFRDSVFSEEELQRFRWLANNYQYTWQVLTKTRLSLLYKWYRSKYFFKITSIIVVVLLFLPTRMSITTKATVVSASPALINAPISGIIHDFYVKPGEAVKKGQLLLDFDKTDLIKTLAIAEKKLLYSEEKVRAAETQGYENGQSRDETPILEAEHALDQSEVDYAKSLLDKADIYSPLDGVAVFDSKEDWIGQPVQAGENILRIVELQNTELSITIPVADLIDLSMDAPGKFYEYGGLSGIDVQLTTIGYNAELQSNKILAYEYKAKFLDQKHLPLLGSQGIVHLYGDHVPLIYFLLRRPLQAIRQTIGF